MQSQRADYGRGQHVLDIHLVDGQELAEKLRAAFSSAHYRPPVLPAVALKVHELTRSADVTIEAVCEVLETDALLSAGVLRLCESAQFARGAPVRSLEQAAMRIGLRSLRDHVFRVAMESTVFRAERFKGAMAELRDHSLLVGAIARKAMARTAHSDEYAFLAGILHDVGLAGSLLILADDERKTGETIDLTLAAPAIESIHEEVGETIATLWKLPPELRWVVGAHHYGEIQGYAHPVACALVMAEAVLDALGHHLRLGEVHVDGPKPAAVRRARETLSFGDAEVRALVEYAAGQIEALGGGA
ncbi:MAG: HDOD domain-containing protein [Myxococcota bacterium]